MNHNERLEEEIAPDAGNTDAPAKGEQCNKESEKELQAEAAPYESRSPSRGTTASDALSVLSDSCSPPSPSEPALGNGRVSPQLTDDEGASNPSVRLHLAICLHEIDYIQTFLSSVLCYLSARQLYSIILGQAMRLTMRPIHEGSMHGAASVVLWQTRLSARCS